MPHDLPDRDLALPVTLTHTSSRELAPAGELAHWHEALEVVCVTQGCVQCQTNSDTFLLGKGDVCLINQKQLHRLIRANEAEGQSLTLTIGLGALMQAPEVLDAYVRPVLEDPTFSHILVHGAQGVAAQVREKVGAIERLLQERPVAFELELAALCHQVFRLLYEAFIARDEPAGPVDGNVALLERMIGCIQERFAENLQLEDIAQAGSVSKSTCSRLFKRYTGRSPIAYLIDYRLETGAALLRSTSEPIAAVARACGFSQQSYFNRMFLRAYRTTPRAYRNAGANGA